MKFISNSEKLDEIFFDLCLKYSHYKWAVAWAGDPDFVLGEFLSDCEDRIERIVVGLHFYQTSPEFIKRYMNNSHVRFYWQTDGTFHSKVYLFYNSQNNWSALVGSSNFTRAGFRDNTEANILITDEDGGTETFVQISEYIDQVWSSGKMFRKADLAKYEDAVKTQKRKLESLSRFLATSDEVMVSSFSSHEWDEFYSRVKNEDALGILNERIDLLPTQCRSETF